MNFTMLMSQIELLIEIEDFYNYGLTQEEINGWLDMYVEYYFPTSTPLTNQTKH
jgi:hypothetical protein